MKCRETWDRGQDGGRRGKARGGMDRMTIQSIYKGRVEVKVSPLQDKKGQPKTKKFGRTKTRSNQKSKSLNGLFSPVNGNNPNAGNGCEIEVLSLLKNKEAINI